MTSPHERLFAVSCAAMFVFGMILGLPGTVLGQPDAVRQFGLTLADRGFLISTLFVGLLFGSLLSGPLVAALGERAALALSSVLVAACFPLFALASSATLATAALFALGLSSATINTAANALSSELFPRERGHRMNVIALMVGLGGLAMPIGVVAASELVSWRVVVTAGAALSLLVSLLAARMPVAKVGVSTPGPALAAFRRHSRQPGFVWLVLLVMLAGGNEASLAGWTSSFVESAGFSPSAATWILSSHWLGLIFSRAAFSRVVERAKEAAVERSAVLSALLLVVLVTASSPAIVALGPFVIGISMALVMPTLLALAGERFPGSSGALFGALLTVAQVGGMVLPAAIGLIAEQSGVRAGLALLVGTYGALATLVRRLEPPAADTLPTPHESR